MTALFGAAMIVVGSRVSLRQGPTAALELAGQLGVLRLPVFLFHEGNDVSARRAFEEIARLTRGAYCPFDASSAGQLRDLLSAVAVYAAGGQQALQDFTRDRSPALRQLTRQLEKR